jgi:hypothetical protein
MINTDCLIAFTRSIEEAPQSVPLLKRWLDRAKELERELSWRVLSLSRFVDELPESSYESYADALASALQDFAPGPKGDINDLESKVKEFAKILEEKGYAEKASLVMKAFDQVSGFKK